MKIPTSYNVYKNITESIGRRNKDTKIKLETVFFSKNLVQLTDLYIFFLFFLRYHKLRKGKLITYSDITSFLCDVIVQWVTYVISENAKVGQGCGPCDIKSIQPVVVSSLFLCSCFMVCVTFKIEVFVYFFNFFF